MAVTYHGDTLINQITLMYGGPNALSKNSSQQFSILEKYQKCSSFFVFFEINEENLIKIKIIKEMKILLKKAEIL